MDVQLVLEFYQEGEEININNLHQFQPDFSDSFVAKICVKNEISIYEQVCRHYHTKNWIFLHPQFSEMLRWKLSVQDLEAFRRLGQIRCASGRSLKKSDLDHFSEDLLSFFRQGLEKFPQAFIRFAHKSFKDSFSVKLQPLQSVSQILDALTSSIKLYKTLDQADQEIYLMKWVEIDPKKEYRVLIIDSRVAGISRQHCYESFPVDDVMEDAELIVEYYHQHFDDFERLNYQTATVDLFVSNGIVNLIEINPPSYWGPSGSSLFVENDFREKFTQKDKIYVKIRESTP